ncbi:MAG: multicopper oxidase family protein [Gammaproteobacteria bacterium]
MLNRKNALDNARVRLLAACVLMSGAGYVFAQAEKVGFREPPLLKAQPRSVDRVAKALRSGTNLLTAGAEVEAIRAGSEIHYILPINYTQGTINNPATGRLDTVRLRSYGDRFLAPTIVMKPGQTVRISLSNRLPVEPDCAEGKGTNQPHCFNITNLHSHGLWVSPTGNSDNVLLSINPQVDFEYVYNVPEDHPTGTFWYHPHKHGSTAIQVGSGMAGVLVIEGDRPPTKESNGDLDTLLRPFAPKRVDPLKGADYAEVMLLQQIPYACFDDQGKIEKDSQGHWTCNDGQVGEVKDFNQQFGGPPVWQGSGRYTLINGVARPELGLRSGKVYRWRLVHAGATNSIALRIRKIGDLTLLRPRAASSQDRADEVEGLCTGKDVTQFEVAADGLTRGQVFGKTTNYLQPGYRSDLLFVLPEDGSYCVIDEAVKAEASVSAEAEDASVLAIITATGGQAVKDQKAFLTEQLLTAADRLRADPEVRAKVKADLRNQLRLSKFVPHPDVTDAEVAKSPVVPIDFNFNWGPPLLGLVNGKPYEPDRIDQTLILGTAQSWRLSSSALSHPFHIHVNPFQIVSVKDKITKKEITTGQYEGTKGVWKDTIFVEGDPNGEKPELGVEIEYRTRYARYIGQFVLHCHILTHEDTGMMQNVEIVLPGTERACAAVCPTPCAKVCPTPSGGH